MAAMQNVRILLANGGGKRRAAANIVAVNFQKTEGRSRPQRFLPQGEPGRLSAALNALFFAFLRSKLRSSPGFTFA